MKIALTGATGFIGRYIVRHLIDQGHQLRCWHRQGSNRDGFDGLAAHLQWIKAELGDVRESAELVDGCDAVIHGALYHPSGGFRGDEGDLLEFCERNVMGSLRLIEAARAARVPRFIFVSTCAVHDKILDDRKLDERHPTWPASHYGAYKAAVEQFVHSYGWGHNYDICALRPTGVYGLAEPANESKWFDLVAKVVRGENVTCQRGGKEVHAADVAKAAGILLTAEGITGECYNCYDTYFSEHDVAEVAKQIAGSRSKIEGARPAPKNQIVTEKLRALGMTFGGRPQFEETIGQLIRAIRG